MAEFVPTGPPLVTSAGTQVVHLQQYYAGIPVFEMVRTVRLSPSGRVEDVVGNNTPLNEEPDVVSTLTATGAVEIALAYVGDSGGDDRRDHHGQITPDSGPRALETEGQPSVVAPLPSQPTQIRVAGLDEPVAARLVLFHLIPQIQLGWLLTLSFDELAGDYDFIVAANGTRAGDVLYCKDTLGGVTRGQVFLHSPAEGPRQLSELPPVGDDLLEDLRATPLDWVSEDRTVGNNVAVYRGNTQRSLTGETAAGALRFEPSQPEGKDQRLLNAFYYSNYLHEVFLMLGFGEDEGNFQAINPGGASGDGDELEVRIYDRVVSGTARMRARRDGRNPEMTLGLVEATGRHTALDADVVFHEYVHGVSQRLVGGKLEHAPLVQPQSRAMGEGWSDYFALTIQNYARDAEVYDFGRWASGVSDGARPRVGSYDSDFTGDFGQLGDPDYSEAHDAGEIWCAALIRINQVLGDELGGRRQGHLLGWQLVVDSLKLIAPSPSFLDGRDGVLKALDDLVARGVLDSAQQPALQRSLWRAFAEYGMGPAADAVGASFEGIVSDFND